LLLRRGENSIEAHVHRTIENGEEEILDAAALEVEVLESANMEDLEAEGLKVKRMLSECKS
jgi:hypothetical protein